MNIYADKKKVNKRQTDSNVTSQFVDNRQEVVAQRKLQEMANNSQRFSQLSAFQAMANSRVVSPVQRVAEPVKKNKGYAKEDAVANLKESRKDGTNDITASWIGYIITKIKPKAGDVKSTYVSSFDTEKGGFSASRELPDVNDLVVHAHYKREKGERDKATVNSAQVKWADNEAGPAPPGQTKLQKGKEMEILGNNHDKIAIKAWEENPQRHKMRTDAEAKKASKQKEEPLDLDWLF